LAKYLFREVKEVLEAVDAAGECELFHNVGRRADVKCDDQGVARNVDFKIGHYHLSLVAVVRLANSK